MILRPGVELEKIITFSGLNLPSREYMMQLSQKLREGLYHNTFINSSFLIQYLNNENSLQILHSAIQSLEEELVETNQLTK